MVTFILLFNLFLDKEGCCRNGGKHNESNVKDLPSNGINHGNNL